MPGKKTTPGNWEKGYYCATFILAVIAVLGFICSICTSNKNTRYFQNLEESVNNFTQPILKSDNLIWRYGSIAPSCEYPPNGFNVLFVNRSNIPIKLVNPNLEVYINDIRVSFRGYSSIDTMDVDSETVLSPGEKTGFERVNPKEFTRLFRNKHNKFEPPFIKLIFTSIISSMNESKKFKMESIYNIGLDCDNFNSYDMMVIKEKYSPI